jgi:hypothetical protein
MSTPTDVAVQPGTETVAPPVGPHRLDDLWLPIGPSTVLGGQMAGTAHTTGRVRQVEVSPDGTRVYAATASGGVWYSRDQGSTWTVLGGWAVTPDARNLDYYANALVCGAILVDWDTTPGGENDVVYVGTGEPSPRRQSYPGGNLGGIGVLRCAGPVAKTRADAFAQVWDREGPELAGLGIYRLAFDPANHDRVLAATSSGLWARNVSGGGASWGKVSASPFDDAPVTSDVLWVSGAPSHLWAVTYSGSAYVSTNGTASFTEVELPDRKDGRLGLAAAADGSVVYALGNGPRLWRMSGTTAKKVSNVPALLFGKGEAEHAAGEPGGTRAQPLDSNDPTQNQSHYDMAVAVDPTNADVVVLGGSAVEISNASLFKCTVQDPNGSPHLSYDKANDPTAAVPDGTAGSDATFIGRGVHADVHGIRFSARGTGMDLWVTCDGGVFRSTVGGANHTWQSRNNGLGVLEPGYLACHPTQESVVVVGTQDNGVLRRTGDTAWKWELAGDGGGVAFHPTAPEHYIAQSTGAHWRDEKQADRDPVLRHRPRLDHELAENDKANFYSSPGVVRATNASGVRLAVGTNRVWVSEDLGRTWFTVKTGSDPRNAPRHDSGQDVFYDDERAAVQVCRWLDENRLYVLSKHALVRFTRDPATGSWDRSVVTDHKNKCFDYKESDIEGAKMPHLPPLGDWSDLAFHLPGPGGTSTLYVACTGVTGAPKMDTLWWFDGVKTWHATGLRGASKAPALAVVAHPTDINTFYVGTTSGVYKGTFSRTGAGEPAWVFTDYSVGLPEAAVQDLAIYHDAAAPMTLLRAALQARGVWEVDLRGPCDEKTFLRVHPYDMRRRTRTSLVDPLKSATASDLELFASPDINLRPAPPAVAAEVPAAPAANIDAASPDPSHDLWTFQTAFRLLVPTCRPTGSWSRGFSRQLVTYKSPNGLGALPEIDAPTWTNVVTQARVWQEPWDGDDPTEADMLQLSVDFDDNTPATFMRVRRLAVDVLVHHRGLQQLAAASVNVLLLLREMTEPVSTWSALPLPAAFAGQVATAVTGGAIPAGGSFAGGWLAADTTPVRHPAGDLDAAHPRSTTFEVDLPATVTRGRYLLLAVCSSSTATATPARLAGATLSDLLTTSSHSAARLLEVFI